MSENSPLTVRENEPNISKTSSAGTPRMTSRIVEEIMQMSEFSQRTFLPSEVQEVTEMKIELDRRKLAEALKGVNTAEAVIHVKRFQDRSVKISVSRRRLRGGEGEFVFDG